MRMLPVAQLGFFNGWLLVAVFYLVFGVLLLLFPKPVVARLYDRSRQQGSRVVQRVVGAILFLVLLLIMVVAPLRPGSLFFAVGLGLYTLGLAGFVVALINFRNASPGRPATSGLYRFSRHPQQLSLSVCFLGISIAIGSWVALALVCVAILGAHYTRVLPEERACLQAFGDSYKEYMARVPRYLLLS